MISREVVIAQTSTPIAVKRSLRELGEHLRTWRKLRGLTIAQVAKRAGLGRGTVTRLERDPAAVSLENLLRVARALGVLEQVPDALDPMRTDIGRLRADEALPQRVRPKRLGLGDG